MAETAIPGQRPFEKVGSVLLAPVGRISV